jgi:hypothetical protein
LSLLALLGATVLIRAQIRTLLGSVLRAVGKHNNTNGGRAHLILDNNRPDYLTGCPFRETICSGVPTTNADYITDLDKSTAISDFSNSFCRDLGMNLEVVYAVHEVELWISWICGATVHKWYRCLTRRARGFVTVGILGAWPVAAPRRGIRIKRRRCRWIIVLLVAAVAFRIPGCHYSGCELWGKI